MPSFQVIKELWFWEVRTSTEGRKEREKEDSHTWNTGAMVKLIIAKQVLELIRCRK